MAHDSRNGLSNREAKPDPAEPTIVTIGASAGGDG
jgi:hypothetical protein